MIAVSSAETFLTGVTGNFDSPVSSEDFFTRFESVLGFLIDDSDTEEGLLLFFSSLAGAGAGVALAGTATSSSCDDTEIEELS